MSRRLRLALAVLLAVIALLAARVALDGTTTHYLLPSPTGPATSHSAAFVPGVVAAALAGLVALAALAWVVVNAVGRPARWAWLVLGGLVAVDLVVLALVSAMPHPAF